MSEPQITVYGAYWCPDCRRSKQFLGEHQIPYNWVDIEQDQAGEEFVIAKNDGKRIIPTIVFEDGSFLVEPTNAALATKLGLKTKASRSHYDVVVIGGGPAGLTAALYLAREGIDTLVIERAAFGGQAAVTEKLDNLPGFPDSIPGIEFANRLRQQAQRFGVELLQAQDVTHLHSHDNYHCVDTASGDEYSAAAVLIATGSRYKRLGATGESNYIGAGVHFCATCDGPFYKQKEVAVIGGGNSAAEESLLLTKFANKVTIIARGDALKASKVIQESVAGDPKVDVLYNTEVSEFVGAHAKLNRLKLHNTRTGLDSELAVDGAFIFIGLQPNTGFLADAPIQRNEWGFISTGHELVHDGNHPPGYETREPTLLESSVPGIFAAGDVRAGSTKQV
ncbi:MAG: FAD-dependent oxidoreductase, partial [Caldilineaceae bacterium]|nr:FAD-dependent oxidoreductase [Caldilineaceae bacterium]